MKSYFEVLNLPVVFDVDLTQLDKEYFTLQMAYHPDTANNNEQKKLFLQLSTTLNLAHENIKDEFLRAKTILQINGIDFDDDKAKSLLTTEFLENIFNSFEQVSLSNNNGDLSEMLGEQYLKKKDIINDLKNAFSTNDLNAFARFTARLRYVDNLTTAIKNKLQSSRT
jgi:molecular chaperone HscB